MTMRISEYMHHEAKLINVKDGFNHTLIYREGFIRSRKTNVLYIVCILNKLLLDLEYKL